MIKVTLFQTVDLWEKKNYERLDLFLFIKLQTLNT